MPALTDQVTRKSWVSCMENAQTPYPQLSRLQWSSIPRPSSRLFAKAFVELVKELRSDLITAVSL